MVGAGGYQVYPFEQALADWARAALEGMAATPLDPAQLRHGKTWYVGVDALANAADGSMNGVALAGAWMHDVALPKTWHRAQVSIIYPGYPKQDRGETDGAHRYRITRYAAHVDGLLPVGPERRRYLQEPHAFILGLPLNKVDAAPLMVWPGSQVIMGAAFRDALIGQKFDSRDLTEVYQAARRTVFAQIEPIAVQMVPGQAVLLHRHLLHGVAPWAEDLPPCEQGRMVAYFRPEYPSGSTAWCDFP